MLIQGSFYLSENFLLFMSEKLTYSLDFQKWDWYSYPKLKNQPERSSFMREKELRRSMSVFPIGTVMKLTDLTARQIRYYEEQDLIHPERSEGNRRMYSLNDIDILLEIKDYLSEGLNMAGIKHAYEMQKQQEKIAKNKKPLTDQDVRQIFYDELLSQGGLTQQNPFKQGPRM